MSKRRGLGRGLGALIPTAPATAATAAQTPSTDSLSAATRSQSAPQSEPEAAGGAGEVVGAHFAELPLSAVRPNPRQPRQVFDAEALAELVASIAEVGLLQPVVVRPATTAGPDGASGAAGTYELVMGERRWRACQEAGLATIPAIVRETADDVMLRDALLENLHRSQLNPLEEGAAYQQLLDDFGCTHEELAGRLGRSRPQITNTLRLLRLPPAVQRRVAAGVLSAGHARALVSVGDPAVQERLANRTVAEGLSVRALEEIVSVGGSDDPEQTGGRRTGPRQTVMAPGLEALADRLSERYDTRVRVQLGKRKGRISVEFASLEDLQRIVALLEPPAVMGWPGSRQ